MDDEWPSLLTTLADLDETRGSDETGGRTMTDTIHAPRRAPAAPDQPVMLATLGEATLAQARELEAGRSARTLTPGAGTGLKQTIVALTEGTRLQEHRAPGPATIQVLHGRVRLGTAKAELELSAGQWAPIPDEVHDLAALSDAALLLTVAPRTR
jgi:quercetin dioxygenase-like cupin family protein